MKNIFLGLTLNQTKCFAVGLGLIFMLVFLPQASFGANPACNEIDTNSTAFFQQQGQERGVFIKAHPDLIAKQDSLGRWLVAKKNAQSGTFSEPSPPPLTAEEESVYTAFVNKQQSDKAAFFQQHAQAWQNCLNAVKSAASPSTSPSGT